MLGTAWWDQGITLLSRHAIRYVAVWSAHCRSDPMGHLASLPSTRWGSPAERAGSVRDRADGVGAIHRHRARLGRYLGVARERVAVDPRHPGGGRGGPRGPGHSSGPPALRQPCGPWRCRGGAPPRMDRGQVGPGRTGPGPRVAARTVAFPQCGGRVRGALSERHRRHRRPTAPRAVGRRLASAAPAGTSIGVAAEGSTTETATKPHEGRSIAEAEHPTDHVGPAPSRHHRDAPAIHSSARPAWIGWPRKESVLPAPTAKVRCACRPGRHLLTERYVRDHGVFENSWDTPTDLPTFVQRVAEAGYHTSCIGKMHLWATAVGQTGGGPATYANGSTRCAATGSPSRSRP